MRTKTIKLIVWFYSLLIALCYIVPIFKIN